MRNYSHPYKTDKNQQTNPWASRGSKDPDTHSPKRASNPRPNPPARPHKTPPKTTRLPSTQIVETSVESSDQNKTKCPSSILPQTQILKI
jgi:hypothetical protein